VLFGQPTRKLFYVYFTYITYNPVIFRYMSQPNADALYTDRPIKQVVQYIRGNAYDLWFVYECVFVHTPKKEMRN